MKKWSEIKQATLDKLFLDEQEAQQQGYLAKFQYLANECLNIIANGVKPRISVFSPTVVVEKLFVDELELRDSVLYYFINGEEHVASTDSKIAYSTDNTTYVFKNNKWIVCDDCYVENEMITMPEDFLSFADMIGYLNSKPDPTVVYITDKQIMLPEPGDYKILYNALWHEIAQEDIVDDLILDIDSSVLNCLPTYIAAQCLGQDDIQRSAILKNEFELLLARLDTNIMYESNHFKSNGGWY